MECRRAARHQTGGEDCADCANRMPETDAETAQVLECFCLCDSQLRAVMGGAYAMDWQTVIMAANSFGLRTDALFFKMLRAFEDILIRETMNNGK